MSFHVPLIIRGRVIDEQGLEFGGRDGGTKFTAPDVKKHLSALTLASPGDLADLYRLRFDDVLDYLHALGDELKFSSNKYLQESYELCTRTSGLAKDSVRNFYEQLPKMFNRDFVRELAENAIGVQYLEGWVARKMASGQVANIRAFGARAVHVLSGNVPQPSAFGVIRNAITRSDAIFKTPSNDPLTAAAIAQTMVRMDANHPLTRHLTVAYWKGGDTKVEEQLYRPDRIEKIIAWGGMASVKHIQKYIQPGIDLITMDPKLSSSIVGRGAFASEDTMKEAAQRLAVDIGNFNQQACANSRTTYIETGTNKGGLETANRFGQMVYDAIQNLPPTASAPAQRMPRELVDEIQSLEIMSDQHKVINGGLNGAIIVSQTSDPVDFAPILTDRVANLIPVDDLEIPIQSVTAYTQTIGVYPENVKAAIRDRLIFNGAQRVVSLGYALKAVMAGPHDGMEPLRRMCKWVTDESSDPKVTPML